jgi:hypothetical protein
MKVRTCQAKKASYSYTRSAASRNKTKIKSDLNGFKSSTNLTSSKTKREIIIKSAAQDLDVLTATTNVINYQDTYIQELNNAINKVDALMRSMDNAMIFTSISQSACPAPTLENLGTRGPLNITLCNIALDVFDNFGCYQKSIYKLTSNINPNQLTTSCLNMGGNPFGILSIHDYGALNYIAVKIYGNTTVYKFPVGGRQLANGSWFHGSQPLYNTPDLPTTYSTTNNCLQVTKNISSIYYKAIPCTEVSGDQFCEFIRPITPLPFVDKSICAKTSMIYGPSGYIKTACYVQYGVDRSLAHGVCQSNGMRLYSIANENDWNGLKNFTTSIFGGAHVFFHVSGERQSDGSWIVNNPNPVPLYSNVSPSTTNKCLIFSSDWSFMDSQDCSKYHYFICEFVNPTLPSNARPVLANCRFDVFDFFHPNGSYYKTSCGAPPNLRFSQLDSFCRASNMYPYAINTANDVNYAICFGSLIYGPNFFPVFQVGGVRDSNGTYFTYTPNKRPVFTDIGVKGTGVNLRFGFSGVRSLIMPSNNGDSLSDGFCEFNRMA